MLNDAVILISTESPLTGREFLPTGRAARRNKQNLCKRAASRAGMTAETLI
jgi:hypothetical protein